MTLDQWGGLIDRYGLAVVGLMVMAAFLWLQGWPWFKERQNQLDNERRDRLNREEEARQARERRYEEQEAKHRADLQTIIAENNAYREKRLMADEKMATAINGMTEMVRALGMLDKINDQLAAIKRELGR